MYDFELIKQYDPEISEAIEKEIKRQQNNIELIASENFVSPAVMATMGSPLTNKYAEGYPNKRYYGGCENVDIVENLARDRAKELFRADHANVQPHSGSQANFAVYFAMLQPGDRVLGMDLSQGGHLTHGSIVNVSGKLYNFISYGLDENGFIDYNKVDLKLKESKAKMLVAGASAYPRAIDFEKMSYMAKKYNALFMVDMAHIAGLVATGLHQSPIPYADFVTTTTHKTLRGPRGGMILCKKEYAVAIDKAIFPGIQGGPLEHVIAAKAVAFKEALSPEFKEYQHNIINNAKVLSESLIEKGFNLVSGGTDNHLMLLDLRNRDITGKDAEKMLDAVGITVNKNSVPNETNSMFVTSGIRIGTPAVTTRGFNQEDMKEIAELINLTLTKNQDNTNIIKERVKILCSKYPLYK